MLAWLRRLRRDARRRQLDQAAELMSLANEQREAEKQARPLGWTSWPPLARGASRTAATLRPPSASRWK
jgi:hypothetical protein